MINNLQKREIFMLEMDREAAEALFNLLEAVRGKLPPGGSMDAERTHLRNELYEALGWNKREDA